MAVEPGQQLHIGRKPNEQFSRPCHDRDERVQLARNAADRHDAHLAPVDLHLLTRLDVEARFGHRDGARPMHVHELLDDGTAAVVAAFLQFVEDALGGPLRLDFVAHPLGDQALVRLEFDAFGPLPLTGRRARAS